MFEKFLFDEPGNGAETVEIVIGIICSVGLGAALLAFQDVVRGAIDNARTDIEGLFGDLNPS